MAGPAAELLAVGRVRRPHGVHGELAVDVTTDFPDRLEPGIEVGVGRDAPERFARVERVRWHKGGWLLTLAGVATRDEAETLRGVFLFLPPLPAASRPENFYYEHELMGLRCVLADGTPLGTVTRLEPGGTGSLLVVAADEGEVLVQFVSPIVVRVELALGQVVLDPPRGLFDGDAL